MSSHNPVSQEFTIYPHLSSSVNSLTFFRWPNNTELVQLQHLACKLWHSWDLKENPDIGTIQGRPDHVIILPRILCRTWNSSVCSFRFRYGFLGEARVLSIQMMPYSKKINKQKTTKRISSHFLWEVLHHWTTWAFLLKSVLSGLPWWRSGWESACQCRGYGFEPWSGRIPHAAEQLGPWATITEPARLEPVLRNRRGRDSERPAHRDEEWPLLAATGESPHVETRTQHSHKNK